MAESLQDESYQTDYSSEEESEDDAKVVEDMPIPFLGRPYPVKTFVNTMNKDVLKEICTGILKMKGHCITLDSNSNFSLQHILFFQNRTFSSIAGKSSWYFIL